MATGLFNFFGGMLSAVFILYVVRTLDIAPGAFGVALAISGCGGLLSAMLAARAVRRLGLGATFLTALVIAGTATSLLPLAVLAPVPPLLLLTAQQTLLAAGSVVYSINAVSLLQTLTPDRLLGRMTATTRVFAGGASPVGALIGGALGSAIGVQATLWMIAAGVLLPVPVLWFSPVRTLVRILRPSHDERSIGTIQPADSAHA